MTRNTIPGTRASDCNLGGRENHFPLRNLDQVGAGGSRPIKSCLTSPRPGLPGDRLSGLKAQQRNLSEGQDLNKLLWVYVKSEKQNQDWTKDFGVGCFSRGFFWGFLCCFFFWLRHCKSKLGHLPPLSCLPKHDLIQPPVEPPLQTSELCSDF